MKFREIRKLYAEEGWELLRQKGSHQIWGKGGERQVIAGSDGADVDRGLMYALLKRIGK